MRTVLNSKVWIGVFWKLLSCGCFAGMNGLVRYLSGGSSLPLEESLPVYTIMAFQNLFGLLFILPWLVNEQKTYWPKTQRYDLHALRVLAAASGTGLWYFSLSKMPLIHVLTLSFPGPILTAFAAAIILKEQMSYRRCLVVGLNILGLFLIARPHESLSSCASYGLLMLLPISAAIIFTSDKVLTRKLAMNQESVAGMTFFLLTFMTIGCSFAAILLGWQTPSSVHWPWLIILGFLTQMAHYSFNKALAYAEITFLMPFGMARIILSGLIGYIAFSETPQSLSMWLGISVIILSTIILSKTTQPAHPRPLSQATN